jgi:hypothetical protein
MDTETEDFEFANKQELLKYIDALCANITDKRVRRYAKKQLLYKLRNEHGDIV